MSVLSLRDLLRDWEDFDVTKYYIACSIGLVKYDAEFREFRRLKHYFWTDSPSTEILNKILRELVNAGVLEFNPDEIMYRWVNGNELS